MANPEDKAILSAVSDEVVSRIVARVFIQLREVVTTSPMSRIRSVVDSTLRGAIMTEGTSFSILVRQLASNWNGDSDVVSNTDAALARYDHIRFQIIEIADAISPIVIQTIRLLDVFQGEADQILFKLQEEITSRITNDETAKNFEIEQLDLGALDDPDTLSTVSAIAEAHLPDASRKYRAHEYKVFAQRVPYASITQDNKAALSKFLVDNNMLGDTIRYSLTNDPTNSVLFPERITDPKTHADNLTSLWEKAYKLNSIMETQGEGAVDPSVKQNTKALLHRVALAIHWGRQAIEDNNRNSLIADRDHNTIYVYPWSYNALRTQNSEDPDETIKNFVRAKNIEAAETPLGGWTVNDVRGSKSRVENLLSQYRRQTVLNQEAHTKAIIRTVCHEQLSRFSVGAINKIIADLTANSDATLQDILNALIERAGDYYLDILAEATNTEEFSSENPNETRSNTVLLFLAKIARDKIVCIH